MDQRIGTVSLEGNPVFRLATADCVYEFEIDHRTALILSHYLGQSASVDAIDRRDEELKDYWR